MKSATIDPPKNMSPAKAALEARKAAKNTKAAPAKKADKEKKPLFSSGGKKFPVKELVKFCRGMGSMLKANINTADALGYYANGHPNAGIKKILLSARKDIENGVPVYTAFQNTGKFDDKFISLIRAGTDSGQLNGAFESIGKRLKKETEFKAKMRKATMLPCIIIFVLILLFIIAQLKIVPQVEGILNDVNQEPDPLSAVLFKVSHITKKLWVFVVGGMVGTVVTFAVSNKARNAAVAILMSKWRILRQLVMGMRQMLFLGSLNMLHSNGVNLAKSVAIAAETLKTTPMYSELMEAGSKYVKTGLPFSEAIKKYTSCDPQVSHMISIGERSSSLSVQIKLLTEMYEEEVDQIVADFSQIVNLMALIGACILISLVFIGAFLPIFLMGPKMMNSGM